MRTRPVSNGVKIQAPAKINLYLEVINRRPDGYHNIETVFQTVSLCDDLYFKPRKTDILVRCGTSGLRSDESNLVFRAAKLLRQELGVSAGAEILLKKRIPMGGGLGGGSSDAAAALKGLLKLWKKRVPAGKLAKIASKLGADVPFFLFGGTAAAKGIGDRIRPLKGVKPAHYLLVNPRFPVPTPSVYKQLKFPLTNKQKINKITRLLQKGSSPEKWACFIFNRLEESVLPYYGVIREIKEALGRLGCRSLMSGSGSTVFAPVSSAKEGERIRKQLKVHPWDVWLVSTSPMEER